MLDRERVQDALLHRVAAGEFDAQVVVRVLAASSPSTGRAANVVSLVRWLEDLGTPEADTLADQLCPEWCGEIRQYLELKAAGTVVPVPLTQAVAGLPEEEAQDTPDDDGLVEALGMALAAQADWLALRAKNIVGDLDTTLQKELAELRATLGGRPDLWRKLLPPWALAERLLTEPGRWENMEEAQQSTQRFADRLKENRTLIAESASDWRLRLRGSMTREQAMANVDELCRWPARGLADVIPAVLEEPWQRRRALLVSTWRLGREEVDNWQGLRQCLAAEAERWRTIRRRLDFLQRERAAELLLLWCSSQDAVPEEVTQALVTQSLRGVEHRSSQFLLRKYGQEMSPEERQRLASPDTTPAAMRDVPATPAETPIPTVVLSATPAGSAPPALAARPVLPPEPVMAAMEPEPPMAEPEPVAEEPEPPPEEPPEPPTPTVWQRHLRPFLTENWLLIAGILGVLAGVSVLVYRYWESTWVIRYAVIQTLLLAGTLALARMGAWLEQRDAKLRDTAVVLTGAAFLLVPINVLCPVMLAGKAGTSGRLLAPVLGLTLLAGFSWWLRRVTLRLMPGVGTRLNGALTGMHGIGFGSLLLAFHLEGNSVPIVLGALPFLLLAACAWSTLTFPAHDPDQPPEPRLATFHGVALCGTFLQLVAWAHLRAQTGLSGAVWTLVVVLAGGLALFADHRLGKANGRPEEHGRTAFAGFSLIMLGLLLSLPFPYIRPVAFLLAGGIWIACGTAKQHPIHAWIGVPLAAIGIIAVAFVPGFPVAWRPAVAMLAAVLLEPTLWRRLSGHYPPLQSTLAGVQSILPGAAVVAVVFTQFHYRHDPRIAVLVIALAACSFAWFAYRDRAERWVRLAAITAAIALPYAGFTNTTADVGTANTMAFGLGLLAWVWIGVGHWGRRVALLRGPRSTILVVYGGCAMVAMAVRLLTQRLNPEAGLVWVWMDTAGPILILAALVLATYWSRSLLPAAMAAVVGAIFAPEMRTFLERVLPQFSWGSGRGSASWGLILVGLCFWLRDNPRLRELGPGDSWWERAQFPWLRNNHTLFTLPALLTAVFLCARVDTFVLWKRVLAGNLKWQTCVALSISGLAWLACAAYLDRINQLWLRLCAYLGVFWLGFGVAATYLVLGRGGEQVVALCFCVTTQVVHAVGVLYLAPRVAWGAEVLVKPARRTLVVASVGLVVVTSLSVLFRDGFSSVAVLACFCAGQLAWHGLRTRRQFFGWLLFPFVLVMAASAGLGGAVRVVDASGLGDVSLAPLGLLIVVLASAVAAERWYTVAFSRGAALVTPLLLGSGALAVLCGGLMFGQVIDPGSMGMVHFWVAAGFILLAARANGWTIPVLLAVTATGVLLAAIGVPRGETRVVLEAALQPWKLGLFGCILLACTHGGTWGFGRWPTLFVSAQAPSPLPSTKPYTALGVLAASMGVLVHLSTPSYRDAAAQVGAPFLSALAFAGAALAPVAALAVPLFVASGATVVLGCVLAMRVFAGPWLRPLGAGEVHLICLGLAVAVGLAETATFAARRRWPARTSRWACAAPAALIPILLVIGYLLAPGLAETNSVRCLISGLCLLVAAVSFRRSREMEEERPVALLQPISLALAAASLSMAVPFLRQPEWALGALLLPGTLLLLLTEVRDRQPESWRKLNLELVFWALLGPLLLHLVPPLYGWLCFAAPPNWLDHFHNHALVPLVAGILMARLATRHQHQAAAYATGPLLIAGCVLTVRVFLGPWLRPLGAGELHLVVLGLATAVILAELVVFASRGSWPATTRRWLCATPAALLLVLLAIGYLNSPGLAETTSVRCILSGLCALVAAFPFRRFREIEGETQFALAQPISLAVAAAALSMAVPFLRQPQWALSALLLPAGLLLVLAELQERQPESWRKLNLELVFWAACAPLLLHLAPPLYRWLCFPAPVRWLAHFHTHALVPLVAGIILARLAAKHRHRTAALAAGPLLATGLYAVVAQWPLTWCFDSVFLPATVWLLALAHIWLGLIASPTLRRCLVGDTFADQVAACWRGFACVASQVVVLWIVLNGGLGSHASAPLLAGAASVLIHAAATSGTRWLGGIALVEMVVSIHLDFLTPSHLPRSMVIWVLLGLWAALLLTDKLLRGRLREQAGAGSQALVLLVFAQICYSGPGSTAGLIGMALEAALYALAPLREKADHVPDATPAALLFLVPGWLGFWWFLGPAPSLDAPVVARACLAAAYGVLIVAPLTVWQGRITALWERHRPQATRRFDTAVLWLREREQTVDMAVLIVVTLIAFVTSVRSDTGGWDLIACAALCAAVAWGWWSTGARRRETGPVVVALAAFFLGLYTIRTQLLLAEVWQAEWDLWAGLALSSAVCALERVFSRQPDYARRPLSALFWALPLANTAWLLSHGFWGTDLPLLLTAVHSLQFAYLGRHEKGSPYRGAAVFGTVAFCLIAFGTHLQLRQAYAYVIPVGLGVLLLVHLFGERMRPQDRNTVRAAALLAMLGSTAYYVIADGKLSLVHILVLALLCLFCMGVAAFTRIRAYLYLGFTGFVVDLGALLYRVLIRLERGAVMTLVGVLVLVVSLCLIAGSLYYKLHREELIAKLRALGAKLGTWE
jgi:hypothetical protein